MSQVVQSQDDFFRLTSGDYNIAKLSLKHRRKQDVVVLPPLVAYPVHYKISDIFFVSRIMLTFIL